MYVAELTIWRQNGVMRVPPIRQRFGFAFLCIFSFNIANIKTCFHVMPSTLQTIEAFDIANDIKMHIKQVTYIMTCLTAVCSAEKQTQRRTVQNEMDWTSFSINEHARMVWLLSWKCHRHGGIVIFMTKRTNHGATAAHALRAWRPLQCYEPPWRPQAELSRSDVVRASQVTVYFVH